MEAAVRLFPRIAVWKSRHSAPGPKKAASTNRNHEPRKPHLEPFERRQLPAADILFGSVYFEEATGDDTAADVIEVTFQGGAEGTTLDQLVIDGDKSRDGLTAGDVFYDIAAGGLGAFDHVGLTIEDHSGFEVISVTIA